MFPAVEAVAEADAVGAPRRNEPDVTAQAAAGELVHAAPPPISAERPGSAA
jgi:hypothetical protein